MVLELEMSFLRFTALCVTILIINPHSTVERKLERDIWSSIILIVLSEFLEVLHAQALHWKFKTAITTKEGCKASIRVTMR